MDALGSAPIATAPRPKCIICGSAGVQLYGALSDRLFGAAGMWHFKRCANQRCGLLWLDPMPLPEEIGKAYENYYTHLEAASECRRNPLKRLRDKAKRGYWARQYGYSRDETSIARALGWAYCVSPIHRREVQAEVRFLPVVKGGRLLDVGCGSGEWLLTMRARGWNVKGVDFDPHAIRAARERGLKVQLGSLEEQGFEGDCFDAITLNHVIEHVPDPLATVRECRRVLKPGGKLVLFTPNSASLSHAIFKDSWRGLEPPRHLHVFSVVSLEQLLRKAGFREITVMPFIVTSVIRDSLLLIQQRAQASRRAQWNWSVWWLTRLFMLLELAVLPWYRDAGDCAIALAVKT